MTLLHGSEHVDEVAQELQLWRCQSHIVVVVVVIVGSMVDRDILTNIKESNLYDCCDLEMLSIKLRKDWCRCCCCCTRDPPDCNVLHSQSLQFLMYKFVVPNNDFSNIPPQLVFIMFRFRWTQ
jgi:hypothetical protein